MVRTHLSFFSFVSLISPHPVENERNRSSSSLIASHLIESTKRFVVKAFLPEGYPHSVSKDYFEYQKWDSLQALCSSVTGLLSTRAILQGGEKALLPFSPLLFLTYFLLLPQLEWVIPMQLQLQQWYRLDNISFRWERS